MRAEGEPRDINLAGVRILLVDDNALIRAVLTDLLEDHGATVISVGSAAPERSTCCRWSGPMSS